MDSFGDVTQTWLRAGDLPARDEPDMITCFLRNRRAARLKKALLTLSACIAVLALQRCVQSPSLEVVELVSRPPGAAVLIDGRMVAIKTPLRMHLRPGRHRIELQHEGYRAVAKEILVAPSDEPRWEIVQLAPALAAPPPAVMPLAGGRNLAAAAAACSPPR